MHRINHYSADSMDSVLFSLTLIHRHSDLSRVDNVIQPSEQSGPEGHLLAREVV